MKRCIKTHIVAGFGEVPAGSLWDDDSPYAENAANFVDDDAPVKPTRSRKES